MTMRTLTEQEKRTVRQAGLVLIAGLVLAGGLWCMRKLNARRDDYLALQTEAGQVRQELDRYQDKVQVAQKLIDTFQFDPLKLERPSLVALANRAIQDASRKAGVAPGAIRETPARGSSREIASIQFEGMGPAPSVMAFLYQLERAGAPLVIDSLRIMADPRMPGSVKVNLTIMVVDFEQWKTEGSPHA
jgi:hypothetical protein